MNHLGNRLAAYVDGELPRVTRELIAAHLSLCSSCRTAVEAESRTKQGLTGLGGPDPSINLLGALLDLAEPGEPMPPRRRPLGAEPGRGVAQVGRPIRIAFVAMAAPAIPFETRGSRARRSLLAAGVAGIAAVTLASAHVQNASGGVEQLDPLGDGRFARTAAPETVHPDVAQLLRVPSTALWDAGPVQDNSVFFGHVYASGR